MSNTQTTTRTVIVASPATNAAKKFETDVQTWGELKQQIAGIYKDGMEAIIKPGSNSLTRDEAQLPNENFSLFLVPVKNKAGKFSEDLAANISVAVYKAILDSDESEYMYLEDDIHAAVTEFFEENLLNKDDDDDDNDKGSFQDDDDNDGEEAPKYVTPADPELKRALEEAKKFL
jgi:hypothetical protein